MKANTTMSSFDHNSNDGSQVSQPCLVIPYWTPLAHGPGDPGDSGTRSPLPADVIPYLCTAIATDAPYVPGKPLSISVSVANWGGGLVASDALVRLWWEDPGTTFAQMRASRLIGATSIQIGPRGETRIAQFPPITLSPLHVCLIACVAHTADPPPTRPADHSLIPLPGLERHWAQHNLSYLVPEQDGSVSFIFKAANPLDREMEFSFDVRPFMHEKLARLTSTIRAEPIETECRVEISSIRELRDAGQYRRPDRTYSTAMKANSTLDMHLRLRLSRVPEPGQYSAFELVQRQRGEKPIGGIALVVVAPDAASRRP